MNEKVLAMRPLLLWAWLMTCLVSGLGDPDAVAASLGLSALLFAAARWSRTVQRESSVALLLLDAPVIFTLRPEGTGLMLAVVLVAGVLTLRPALLTALVLELVVMQLVVGGTGLFVAAAVLSLGAWVLLQRSTEAGQ